MDIKRVLTALIGFPIIAAILIFGNKYVIDITFSIIAMFALYEFFNSFKEKNTPIRWIAYVDALSIALIHVIPSQYALRLIAAIIPISISVLFAQVIITNMKYTLKDIAITAFGICYIVIFFMYIPVIRQMDHGMLKIWYLVIAAWGTDTFAYLIGKRFGKHHFTKVSPNKSIEGCIAGIAGSVVLMSIYTFVCNVFLGMNFNYLYIILIAIVLSIAGQLGDLAASSVKRYSGIKDFSNILPGHGGILDRMDSILFIAPFAYFLFMLL